MQKKTAGKKGGREGANASVLGGRIGHEEKEAEPWPFQPWQGGKAGYHIISAAVWNDNDNKQQQKKQAVLAGN